ncbi:MAG: type II toxin-antitoxin system RelE/ParE family toxin [Bacteroidetes bacterium]|nr:type II toxin-antitoxin system RelE/ParE family toxin [Bacteroidota bacterium]MBI3482067.1 type II toxin-antitoxin system RelE/ParE family toxin [Bacteroidota bacterium]
MIVSFGHKGLKSFFEKGDSKRLNSSHVEKIRNILARLSSAKDLRDMNYPGSNLHPLKKPPFRGFYSVNVSGNYRIVFRFENGDAYDVDYLDTH